MVDVFLINPGLDDHPRERENTAEPLGLGYIASFLEARGFSVEVLDLCVCDLMLDDVVRRVFDATPAVVGLSVYTANLRGSYAIIKALGEGGLTSRIVVGGPHVTADPHIVVDIGADCGMRGECELVFSDFCGRVIKGGGDFGGVGGFVGGLGSRFVVSEPQKIKELDNLPFPKRSKTLKKDYKHTGVITSRGCPHNCSFCFNAKTGYRQRSPQNVVDELAELRDTHKVKTIDFVDDVFGLDKNKTTELCKLIQENASGLRWNCTTRADCIDEELLTKMHDTGLEWVSVGVESGNEKIRQLNGKNIKNEDYKKFFKLCKRIGIKTRAYVILGLPGERVEDTKTSKEFVESLAPDDAQYNLLDVLPETEVYYKFLRRENQNKTLWREYMVGNIRYPIYLPDNTDRHRFHNELERLFGRLPFNCSIL